MRKCFVIQPFDSGKFDKRFNDVYKPALEQAGLEAYRVDRDPSVEVPIDSIGEHIRSADICLADITTNNPNVWYELGYALAAGRSVIMVCSDERDGKLPFDIHHRTVITYTAESLSDFDSLREKISTRAKTLLEKTSSSRDTRETQVVEPNDLTRIETKLLAIAAAATDIPGSAEATYRLKQDSERSGLSGFEFGLALRRLQQRKLVEFLDRENDYGERYQAVVLSDLGWRWIDCHESLLSSSGDDEGAPATEDDIPF